VSSRDLRPEDKAADLHDSEVRRGSLGVTGGNAAPAFKAEHGVFDQMTQLIEIFIVVALDESVLFGRDHRSHPLLRRLFQDGVGIVAPVGQKILGRHPFDQRTSLRTIRSGTCCNKDSDRVTMRIHGQMYLGVEPPFVMSMA